MTDIKERVALSSIAASAALCAGKFIAAFSTGSLGLLSDAMHAALDVGATILTYFAVRWSGKPADDTHHYGHGKSEAVAALIETGLLFVVAFYVAVEAIGRLWSGHSELQPSWIAFAVLGISIVVDILRSRTLQRVAKETKSQALAADALHFQSDLVSSSLVLLGLIAATFGFPQGDTIAAIAVAGFIGIAGYRLGKRTIDTLMDAAPPGLEDQVRAAVVSVRGVVGLEQLRVRSTGAETFADIQILVPRTLPLHRIETIKSGVRDAVKAAVPDTDVTIAANGLALDDETVHERVLHVAAGLRRPVHHVTVQHIGERLSVSLDLEIDGRASLSEAHRIASELEAAIVEELGPGIEVETHIEPLDVQALEGRDLPPAEHGRIQQTLAQRAADTGVIRDVHDVRVRQTAQGLVVNYHCTIDGEMSVHDMHVHVDAVERAVRADLPEIVRVVGHAEPAAASGIGTAA